MTEIQKAVEALWEDWENGATGTAVEEAFKESGVDPVHLRNLDHLIWKVLSAVRMSEDG